MFSNNSVNVYFPIANKSNVVTILIANKENFINIAVLRQVWVIPRKSVPLAQFHTQSRAYLPRDKNCNRLVHYRLPVPKASDCCSKWFFTFRFHTSGIRVLELMIRWKRNPYILQKAFSDWMANVFFCVSHLIVDRCSLRSLFFLFSVYLNRSRFVWIALNLETFGCHWKFGGSKYFICSIWVGGWIFPCLGMPWRFFKVLDDFENFVWKKSGFCLEDFTNSSQLFVWIFQTFVK